MKRLLVVGTATLIWGSLFGLSLAISKLDLGYCKWLCGTWGCLAAVAPLLSVHAMWLTLLGGFAWLLRLAIPFLQDRRLWFSILLASLLAVCGVLGFDIWQYFGSGGSLQGLDWIKYPVSKLVARTDLPLVQVALSSLLNLILELPSRKCANSEAHRIGEVEADAPTALSSIER